MKYINLSKCCKSLVIFFISMNLCQANDHPLTRQPQHASGKPNQNISYSESDGTVDVNIRSLVRGGDYYTERAARKVANRLRSPASPLGERSSEADGTPKADCLEKLNGQPLDGNPNVADNEEVVNQVTPSYDINDGELCRTVGSQPIATTVDQMCACVVAKSERPGQVYRRTFSENARRDVCEEVISTGLVSKFTEAVQSYAHNAVISEHLKVAGLEGSACSAGSMRERFTKLGNDYSENNNTGKRDCSSQSLSYLIEQIESSAAKCKDSNNTSISSCPIPDSVTSHLNITGDELRERKVALKILLERTRALDGPPAGSTPEQIEQFLAQNPEQRAARLALRSQYEQYIDSSTLENQFAEVVDHQVESRLRFTFGSNDPTLVEQDPLKKKKALFGILEYIFGLPNSDPQRSILMGSYPALSNSFPKLSDVINRNSVLTDAQTDQLLSIFQSANESQCNRTTNEFANTCKMLTPGSIFDTTAAESIAVANPNVLKDGIIGNHLNSENWIHIINATSNKSLANAADMQALMCAIHYKSGGMTSDKDQALAHRGEGNGYHTNLLEPFNDPEVLNNALLGSRSADVLATFDNCSPFAASGAGAESRLLYDENFQLPYNLGDAFRESQVTASSNRGSIIEGSQTTQETVAALRGAGFFSGGSGSSSSSRDEGIRSGIVDSNGLETMNRDTRRELESRSQQEVTSQASDFYNSMEDRRIEQATSSFMNTFASRSSAVSDSSDLSSNEDIDTANAAQELQQTRSAIEANDTLLRQLAELERKNNELNARLQEMNISTIEDEDGNTVNVADAFARTRERIERQREQAIQERNALEERERVAQSFVSPARGSNAVATQSESDTSNFNANVGSNNTSRNSNNLSSSAGNSSTSDSASSRAPASIASSSSSSNFEPASYGPIPYSGIILSVDELSIARPQLDLGGRSLEDSADLIRAAILEVQSALRGRESTLPAYTIGNKSITEYIVQEQNGEDVIVYIDGDEVKIQTIDLSLESTQVVAEEEPEQVVERAPASEATPVIESAGRKNIDALNYSWDFVKDTLDESQKIE